MAGSDKRKRHKTTTIRFTPDELDTLKSRAKRAGLSLGGYVRQEMLDAPPPRQSRRPVIEKELLSIALSRMGKIGSNVNQLARTANRGRIPEKAALRAASDAVIDIQTLIRLALGFSVDPAPKDGNDDH